jgi:dUTPase
MEKIEIRIQRISENFVDIPLPEYATEGSSGFDVRAAVETETIIPKGKVSLIPTNQIGRASCRERV